MSPVKVLLFGASGYLGGAVADVLGARDAVVVRAGRRAAGPDWVVHDLVSGGSSALADLLEQVAPDVVVNCAGRLDGSAADLVAANVTATAHLLDAVSDRGTRLVVLGSAAEYGVVTEGVPVAEDAPTNPVAPYGITKLASTGLVRAAVASGRVDAVALRVFNPIGAGMPEGTVLGRAAASLRKSLVDGGDVVLGPLGAYRDFVDVADVADAVASAALVPDLAGESVLNVGSGVAVTVRDAVKLLVEAAGFTGRVVESDPPPNRSGGVDWIAADLTRTTGVLDWSPRRPLAESVTGIWSES
ncbi:NAD(P)-dependent oxidoreductase [Saccharothrix violaceirubra]|uniref:Nucleoside-diphosphate-sugar epimerase n=1 Tax=Saccharothrix violaceirubra TaxID=413306 RepID=A0A7W7WVN9_9PSEU|nr:NAD(P)-dependent oxidoreductase [Saccharothrix violaceirubra]MBB4965087.1 nucleoside-diphosphate-sugar epimerase [Saccharothrix violaceirubra]